MFNVAMLKSVEYANLVGKDVESGNHNIFEDTALIRKWLADTEKNHEAPIRAVYSSIIGF
jgi:hypothetical protein